MKNKVLIIRLSSFGDIVQCMSILEPLTQEPFDAQVDWLVRSDLKDIPALSKMVGKVWSFDRNEGLLGLIKLAFKLRSEGYKYVYDAHSSMRSRAVCAILRPFGLGPVLARRSKDRLKRILLFNLGINKFSKPFRGMLSYQKPILNWGIKARTEFHDTWIFDKDKPLPYEGIAIAPSAAWAMKRWPLGHWKSLITKMEKHKFIVLGGPGDHFCQELEELAPDRVRNLAGKLSLMESCQLVSQVPLLISADTGLIHVADLLGVKGISLMGPTAFGFATNKNIKTLEVNLECRPCTKDGRGGCSQSIYQKCMVDITPELVCFEAEKILNS